MKTLPTQERALKKRQALINAAIEEFSTIGFEAATAKSIAASAKVATGTFYQYFENKDDILRVIALNRFDNLHEKIKSYEVKAVNEYQLSNISIEAEFLEKLIFVYEFHVQNPVLHQVLEQRRALDLKLQEIIADGEYILRMRVLAFVNTFNITDSELVAENLFAMTEGLVHRLVFHSSENDPQRSLAVGAKMLASYFVSNQINNL